MAVYPAFPAEEFVTLTAPDLAPLELKGRIRHIAGRLRTFLPDDWPAAVGILVRALSDRTSEGGFWAWPVLQVLEDHAGDPEVTLPALRALTGRSSAEFAIRPLLVSHPEQAWAAVSAWAGDADPHVRRLASEGTRPRLPWGRRLEASVRDPSRGIAVLDQLVDDPSEYVRRSVANHLGDVAKDHPDVAVAVARRWLAVPSRGQTVRHALRTLLKAGHPDALALSGHPDVPVEVREVVVTPVVKVGEKVEITAIIRVDVPARVRVDVVWSWPGARGNWSSRTFRGDDRDLQPGEPWQFRHRFSTRPVTTRPTRPGTQRVTLRVNGKDVGPFEFQLG